MILEYSNASKAVSAYVDGDDKCFTMLDIADSQNGNVPSGQTRTRNIRLFTKPNRMYSRVPKR